MTMEGVNVVETLDEDGKPKLLVTSDKYKAEFTVNKTNDGYAQFFIAISKGKLPKELEGRFTTPLLALNKLTAYLKNKKESAYVARDKKYKENHPDDSTVLSESV